ncbi:MAG: hypothetical protein ACPGWR_16990 [Ardenticatenaceae bacterium]
MSTQTLDTLHLQPRTDITPIWSLERFPVLSEAGQIKAVMVDIASFARIQLILDNLLNREAEPEDAMLAASTTLKQLLASAQQQAASSDWESELDEL